ncbi:MAG TPA: Ppx/GppA phosphatase family protein [Polyangiaceae bacterium]|nr:Ppx/GppA phosphatase family protein [Polyangiaceae bacterium]
MVVEREARDNRFAAVDLGSNSFHLLVARWEDEHLAVLDRKKETVRLAAGLDADRNLSPEKQAEAIAALHRLGDLLKSVPPENRRAVGTNTLRAARNSETFLQQAKEALGCPIEIISGKEEARLVYVGVSHSVQPAAGNQLVVDIGGGSTECVIGRGFSPLSSHSLRMGCVTYSLGFFSDGSIKEDTLRAAIFAASNEVATLQHEFLDKGFEVALGSSGTIGAIQAAGIQEGWSDGAITQDVLNKLRKHLVKAGAIDKIRLRGVSERRREVLPGGVAILSAIFDRLHLERMAYAEGALRDGVLYDLIGRTTVGDVRDGTVRSMQTRYGVSVEQADRVWRRLENFLDQVAEAWDLAEPEWRQMGRWAAALHEVGLAINYPGHHKHGAYLIEHSELAGFSLAEQKLLATLVLCHRRKLRPDAFAGVPGINEKAALKLTVLLRLAVLVERHRGNEAEPRLELSAAGRKLGVKLTAEGGEYSLLGADLAAEAQRLQKAKFELSIVES